jgi:hypothetical protein
VRNALPPSALALALGLAVTGCALLPPAPTSDERARDAARRLQGAPSDSARYAVAVNLFTAAGLTPLAGERFTYRRLSPVVAGFVPGRTPGERDTLVVVAGDLSGPSAGAVVEAARLLAETAARNEGPERTVLVALWGATGSPQEGLADVLAFPLWPAGAVRGVLVVGGLPGREGPAPPEAPPLSVSPDGVAPAVLVDQALALAARPVRAGAVSGDSAQAHSPPF